MEGLGWKHQQIRANWLLSGGRRLLRQGCPGLQAAEGGQSCACPFALLLPVFLWPLSASWPRLFTNGCWSWDALEERLHRPLQPGV